ncbi:helix-turn-helix domain-containing protein [Paraburkholderia sp. SIMBA_027]|uniref:helix-turn-helix domain-containing protein n=1 Tax=Paraburkholderia sp. SIMBA_027 TaxID=3085770 RepID=UPI00397A8666
MPFVEELQPLKRSRSTKPSTRLLKLRSKTYRSTFAKSVAGNQIATQIRLLRESAGLSQAEMAKKLGTRQSAIARLEDPDYGRQSLTVLHKIAQAFDVAAWIEFVPYSTLLRRTADLSPAALTPKPYTSEFDESGEPNTSVDVVFDGSVICKSNYVTSTAGSIYIAGNAGMPPLAITKL